MAIEDEWGTLKKGCPNCGGDLGWSYFGADCRGNPPSAGASCRNKCGFQADRCLKTKERADEFLVHKPTFEEGHRAVLKRRLGAKQMTMIYAKKGARHTTRNTRTAKEDRERFCVTDQEVLSLAGYAIEVISLVMLWIGAARRR